MEPDIHYLQHWDSDSEFPRPRLRKWFLKLYTDLIYIYYKYFYLKLTFT